jgi:hypothetical protein
VLFAFDQSRKAIFLVGGDKSGDWQGWYRINIPIADERFDQHQAEIDKSRASKKMPAKRKAKRRGKDRR